jgi:poly(3-hydroxybutyrate) depolymerase
MQPTQHLVESAPLPYLLRLPRFPGTAPGGHPVLCFLHGYEEGAPTPLHEALTRHGPLREGSSTCAGRFIVVAPQLPSQGDAWHRHADDVHELVRHVQALHGGDPARTYLTGFSFGGNGVFDVALRQRQFWAALWSVDPTRVPAADPGRPLWLSSGALSRRIDASLRSALRLAEPDTAGERVIRDAGLDHVGTATAAYAADTTYDWLLGKRL